MFVLKPNSSQSGGVYTFVKTTGPVRRKHNRIVAKIGMPCIGGVRNKDRDILGSEEEVIIQ